MRKPRLGVFLNGLPDVENFWHLIASIQAEGKIEMVPFVPSALVRRDSRVAELFRAAGFRPVIRPNRLMKCRLWYSRALATIDRLLVIADPATDSSSYAARSRWIASQGMPTTYLQHGVIQEGLTYLQHTRQICFHSDMIVLWQPATAFDVSFAPDTSERFAVVGFLKKPLFATREPDELTKAWLASFHKRLLICHSFRAERQSRYAENFYEMIDGFLSAYPEIGVVIRPHRGKERRLYSDTEKSLQLRHPNLRFSYAHTGSFRGMSITDVIAHVDALVSTPSTALLDGLYLDRPTAQMYRDFPMFDALPQVSDAESLSEFLSNGWTQDMSELRNYYGNVDINIGRVVNMIAEQLGKT